MRDKTLNYCFLAVFYLVLLLVPVRSVYAGNLTSASDTLQCPSGATGTTCGGSRLSYRAQAAANSTGASVVTIQSGSADTNTNHLFPGDQLCISSSLLNGCQGQTAPSTYQVANIPSTTTFNMKNPLTGSTLGSDFVIASQSAQHVITFTTTNAVPSNGSILITVPAIQTSGKTNDGFPDTAASVASNGFDLNSLATTNVTVTAGCTPANWTVASVTAATGANNHTITINRATSSCAAGSTITINVGDSSVRMINPAPVTSGHTQGTADVYTINVKTRDGSSNTLDTVDIKVAPVEAVFVSATVDTSLSFSIAGIASAQSKCGVSTSVTTTATTVPWGTISTANSFLNAAQLVSASTNATSGYAVRVEENDQLGRDGVTCTGATAGESVNCIKDTTCDGGACTEAIDKEWVTATNNGFGYSLQNVTNSDAAFQYNVADANCTGTPAFCSKQFADQEAAETKAAIMSAAAPRNNSQVNVCYKISTSSTQPAGYYYNVVRYTATPIF